MCSRYPIIVLRLLRANNVHVRTVVVDHFRKQVVQGSGASWLAVRHSTCLVHSLHQVQAFTSIEASCLGRSLSDRD